MSSKKAKGNPIVIRPGATIGNPAAEDDDEFLFSCFVHHPILEQLLNTQDPGMVLSGRTGAGKTALLRYVERGNADTAVIDPFEMSMSYVSNSDVIRFLEAIGADLDLFFQILWKHVLCIEFIRTRFRVNNEDKSRGVFSKIAEGFFGDARKRKAVTYLRDWEGKFWITMDENIREITERTSKKLEGEVGGEIQKFKTRGSYEKQMSVEKKREIANRVKKIINAEQLAELNGVIELLSDRSINNQATRCYLLIDKLDERWVDDSIRFRLIRALIEALRSFRKIENLKIIVSIGADVVERVTQENRDLGFQREKYDSYFLRLIWSEKLLKQLVESRIQFLYRRKYTQENVGFDDIFTHKIGNQEAFSYLLERTLYRPRDILSFVNTCLLRAADQKEVSPRHIREAEADFSRIRMQALIDEWQSAFPSLSILLTFFSGRGPAIEFDQMCSPEVVDEVALPITALDGAGLDPMVGLAHEVFGDNAPAARIEFARHWAGVLYRVGAAGIKLQPTEKTMYSHFDAPVISTTALGPRSRIRIHQMLHRALSITPS